MIHVNFLGAEVDTVYFPQIEVVGDIANAVWRLKEASRSAGALGFHALQEIKQHFDEHLAEGQHDDRFPMYPVRIVNDVRETMPVGRHRLSGQRHVQDLVRALLPRARTEFAAAR